MDISGFWEGAIVLIAIFTARTAWSQYSISKEKFKLDLFEKRFLVFKATRNFLSIILREAKISLDDIYEYRANTSEATFFFEKDIISYLEKIDNKALELWRLHEEIKDLPKGNERSEKVKNIGECLKLLTNELPAELKVIFNPYMKVNN